MRRGLRSVMRMRRQYPDRHPVDPADPKGPRHPAAHADPKGPRRTGMGSAALGPTVDLSVERRVPCGSASALKLRSLFSACVAKIATRAVRARASPAGFSLLLLVMPHGPTDS